MNVYYWPQMNTWHTPANAGQFQASISDNLSRPILTCNSSVDSIFVSQLCAPYSVFANDQSSLSSARVGVTFELKVAFNHFYVLQGCCSYSYIREYQQQGTLTREVRLGVSFEFYL
jgi:hypothetical protein